MQELSDRRASEAELPQLFEEEKDDRLNLFGEFVAKHYEDQYRQYILKSDNRQATILVLVILGATGLFAFSDYRLFGLTTKLLPLIGVRIVLIMSSVIWLNRLNKISEPRTADAWLLGYILVQVVGSFYIILTRPPTYLTHTLVTLLEICLIYLVFPLPLRFQIIPALLFSLGEIFLVVIVKPSTDGLSNRTIIFCFSCANFIGVMASRRAHYWKRRQFIALLRETAMRQKLEQAIAEIRTLRGMIPICSYCKRIRHEAGAWEQIEAYVTTHTHAQFSHGFCPECAEEHLYVHLRNRQNKA